MAQCPTCGSDVSEQATFCPDCGTDLKPAAAASPGGAPGTDAGVPTTPAPSSASTSTADPVAPSAVDPVPPATPELGIDAEPANAVPGAGASPASSAAANEPAQAAPVSALPVQSATSATAARLVLKRSGAPTSEVFPVGGHVVIGRFDPETGPVDVDLGSLPEANYVSRMHAEILPDGSGQWKVKDLGSRNGVFVRKPGGGQFQRVTGEEAISGGDEIALGNARFEFQVG